MPARERQDTSYVSVELTCGDTIRIVRSARPVRNGSVFCFTCKTRGRVLKVSEDEEWCVRCADCRYARRTGQSDMKAGLLAGTHHRRRQHSVRIFHEKDPTGTEIWWRMPDWREVVKMEIAARDSDDDAPPF